MSLAFATLAAFLGGIAGSGSRQLVTIAAEAAGGSDLVARMLVNVVGGLLAGALLARREADPERLGRLEPLVAAGFLGGFTTVTGYALDASQAIDASRWVTVASLVTVDGAVGLLAAALGHRLARGVASPAH